MKSKAIVNDMLVYLKTKRLEFTINGVLALEDILKTDINIECVHLETNTPSVIANTCEYYLRYIGLYPVNSSWSGGYYINLDDLVIFIDYPPSYIEELSVERVVACCIGGVYYSRADSLSSIEILYWVLTNIKRFNTRINIDKLKSNLSMIGVGYVRDDTEIDLKMRSYFNAFDNVVLGKISSFLKYLSRK